jgi:hypothetical protein
VGGWIGGKEEGSKQQVEYFMEWIGGRGGRRGEEE